MWTNQDFINVNAFLAEMQAVLASAAELRNAADCAGCREVLLNDLDHAKESLTRISDAMSS